MSATTVALSWTADVDDCEDGLVVMILDGDYVVDATGAVDVPFTVSDHGNVLFDEHDPFVVGIVADMLNELEVDA